MTSKWWTARTTTIARWTSASTSTDRSRTCTRASSFRQSTSDQWSCRRRDPGRSSRRARPATTSRPWVRASTQSRIRTFCQWRMALTMNNWFSQRIESRVTWAMSQHKSRTTSARSHSCVIQNEERKIATPRVMEGRIFFRWRASLTWTRAWCEQQVN